MIIIYARKKVADQTIQDTDINLAIKKTNINFDNNSGLLSSYTARQLYDITRKNNLNVDWEQFDELINTLMQQIQVPILSAQLDLLSFSDLAIISLQVLWH